MVEIKKGNELKDIDIVTINYILSSRCSKDYHETPFKTYRSQVANDKKLRSKKYTVYIADDWYLIIKKKFKTIVFVEMAALEGMNNKRTIEMYKTLRTIVSEYIDYQFVSTFRHDTTYKLFQFLQTKDLVDIIYSDVYSMYYDLDKRDEMIYDLSHSKELSEEYYKYIMHTVRFKFKSKVRSYVNR